MSVLRQLQTEWNLLVPQAQASGLRGVREVRLYPEGLHERITHRRRRLDWLRQELNLTSALVAPAAITDPTAFTFGVELELIMPRGMSHAQLASHIAVGGVPCVSEVYNHSVRNHWKVVTDGSLGDYYRGAEVVSPVLQGQEGFEATRKVCQTLTRLGCKVNRKCGLHVHVGVRNEQIDFFKRLARLYQVAETAIDQVLAPSRRGYSNVYCQPVRVNSALDHATTVSQVASTVSSSRYCKLNLHSFARHGTVEFRQHQGTVEGDKVIHWVQFCLRMCLGARKGVEPANSLESLLVSLEATDTELNYFRSRASYFAARVNQTRAA